MPRTASTRNTDKDRPRSRSSFNERVESSTAPILFRLPAIVPPKEFAVDDSAAEASAAAIEEAPLAPAPSPTTAVPLPPARENPGDGSTAEPATRFVATAEQRRSWWEHWSSGILLILLIIALVAASIVALNDPGKSTVDQLASAEVQSAIDEFDLADIQIPDVYVPDASPPVHDASVAADRSAATSTSASGSAVALASKAETEEAALDQASPLAIELPASNDENLGFSEPLELSEAVGSELLVPGTATVSAPVAAAAPKAALSVPLELESPPLFTEPASSKVAEANLSKAVPDGKVRSLAVSPNTAPGSSPAFYDGAATGPEQQTAAMSNPNPTGSVLDTNLPAYSAVLVGSSSAPPVTTASQRQQMPVLSTNGAALNGPVPPPSSSTSGSDSPAVVPSATPELNAEAIIQAYMYYQAMNRAMNGPPDNRYHPNTVSPTSPGNANSQTGQGFTLGSPRQAGPTYPAN